LCHFFVSYSTRANDFDPKEKAAPCGTAQPIILKTNYGMM